MKKRGQALVEFIIILPVLIMLFFGAVDFGRIILKKNNLESLSNDIVSMYEEGKTYDEIDEYLKASDGSYGIEITNKDNKYIEFILKSKIEFITPGLKQILGKDYEAETKRVISYE